MTRRHRVLRSGGDGRAVLRSGAVILLGALAGTACGEPAPSEEREPAPAETAAVPGHERAPSPGAAPASGATETPAPGADRDPERELRAFGTEPFWSVTVGADSIRLLDMATGDTIAWPATEPIAARARPAELARAWILDGDGPVVLMVRRAPQGCSDGMSDNLYPWLSLFLRGDRLYEGCARTAEPSS